MHRNSIILFLWHPTPPPQTEGKWGHIAFGADPVSVANCLHSVSGTDEWILTHLVQTQYWEGGNKWLGFSDVHLIFMVTPALWNFQIFIKKKKKKKKKKLVCT